jgi:hypothetical protein
VFAPLAAGALPFPAGDYTGAIGWARSVAPGQSVAISYRYGHNCLGCTQAAGIARHGQGWGTTTLAASASPMPGCAFALDVTGPPAVTATLLLGGAVNLQIPGCPQSLLVDPFASRSIALDGGGRGAFGIPPGDSPVFCGLALACQVFTLVPGEPCFPLQHSDGMTLVFGN